MSTEKGKEDIRFIPSESMVLEQLVAYSGLTAIIENLLKIAFRWYKGVSAADAG